MTTAASLETAGVVTRGSSRLVDGPPQTRAREHVCDRTAPCHMMCFQFVMVMTAGFEERKNGLWTSWRGVSRSSGIACVEWRTGCSVRAARPRTLSRKRGCGSAGPTRATCQPRRLADHRGVAGLSGHAAQPQVASGGLARHLRARPDPEAPVDPEEEAVRADAVGLAMIVVLDTLSPAERLAFVLHDMFGLEFRRDRRDRRQVPGRRPAARLPRAPPRSGRPGR